MDPFCCELSWDELCAQDAAELCGDLCVPPPPPAGACCLAGACAPDVTEEQCVADGGVWQGAGTECGLDQCPPAPPPTIEASLDIKPGSCPNPWNSRSQGKLPVTLLGTADFDVTLVDLASLALSRVDGVGNSVAPLFGGPPHNNLPAGPRPGPGPKFHDTGTPFDGEACECHDLQGDGITDLSLKFSSRALAEALQVGDLPRGSLVELVLTGQLLDGTSFTAHDCIRLVGGRRGNQGGNQH
jgi:hypothetical protein